MYFLSLVIFGKPWLHIFQRPQTEGETKDSFNSLPFLPALPFPPNTTFGGLKNIALLFLLVPLQKSLPFFDITDFLLRNYIVNHLFS